MDAVLDRLGLRHRHEVPVCRTGTRGCRRSTTSPCPRGRRRRSRRPPPTTSRSLAARRSRSPARASGSPTVRLGGRTNAQNSPPSGSSITLQCRSNSSAGSSIVAPKRDQVVGRRNVEVEVDPMLDGLRLRHDVHPDRLRRLVADELAGPAVGLEAQAHRSGVEPAQASRVGGVDAEVLVGRDGHGDQRNEVRRHRPGCSRLEPSR